MKDIRERKNIRKEERIWEKNEGWKIKRMKGYKLREKSRIEEKK